MDVYFCLFFCTKMNMPADSKGSGHQCGLDLRAQRYLDPALASFLRQLGHSDHRHRQHSPSCKPCLTLIAGTMVSTYKRPSPNYQLPNNRLWSVCQGTAKSVAMSCRTKRRN